MGYFSFRFTISPTQVMAADATMDTCPSPEIGDSRKRPLDGDSENGSTKRSHFSTGEFTICPTFVFPFVTVLSSKSDFFKLTLPKKNLFFTKTKTLLIMKRNKWKKNTKKRTTKRGIKKQSKINRTKHSFQPYNVTLF